MKKGHIIYRVEKEGSIKLYTFFNNDKVIKELRKKYKIRVTKLYTFIKLKN